MFVVVWYDSEIGILLLSNEAIVAVIGLFVSINVRGGYSAIVLVSRVCKGGESRGED